MLTRLITLYSDKQQYTNDTVGTFQKARLDDVLAIYLINRMVSKIKLLVVFLYSEKK